MLKEILRIFSIRHPSSFARWKDIEYFDDKWKERIAYMASFIPKESKTIMDLGCGKMWLKEFLDETKKYIPVDYTFRGEGTLICDFNKHEFPSDIVNLIFVSGTMEYIQDTNWFVTSISHHTEHCVLSYCVLEDYRSTKARRKSGWVNDFTTQEVIDLFEKNNMVLLKHDTVNQNRVFLFKHREK